MIPWTEPFGQRFEASQAATVINSVVYWLAGISLVAGWAVWVLFFTPSSTSLAGTFSEPFMALAALTLFWAIIMVNGGRLRREDGDRFRPGDLLRAIPPRMRPLLALAVLAIAATAVITMTGPAGAPVYDQASHRYYLDLHGVITPATREVYLHATVADDRVFLSVSIAVISVAFAVASGERARRRAQPPAAEAEPSA